MWALGHPLTTRDGSATANTWMGYLPLWDRMSEPAVMIITGASRGIGAATAKAAAKRGYAVCVNYEQARDSAEEVVSAIRSNGGHAIACRADISSEQQVLAMFRQVDSTLGRVTALINNAATIEPQMRLDSMAHSRMERIFAVNVLGSLICSREAVLRMSTRYGGPGGAIVNVSSGAAKYSLRREHVTEWTHPQKLGRYVPCIPLR